MNIEQLILEEYTKIQEQAADKLRQSLPSGYTEKDSEIDSGGEMSIFAVKLFIKFFKFLKKEYPEVSIQISGGHDEFHSKYKSGHNTGEALDFVVTSSSADKAKVAQALKQFKSSNSDFSYLDEYETPTEHATGPHFHIQYVGPSSQGNMFAKDVSDIDSGESVDNTKYGFTPNEWKRLSPYDRERAKMGKLRPNTTSTDSPTDSADEWGVIDYFQTVLDFAGFIPGYGEVIDVINASIYFARDKYVDGVLSLIGVVPVIGDVVGKGMKASFKLIGMGKVSRALRKAKKGNPGDMQKIWETMLKNGYVDGATLKQFAKAGDNVAGLLTKSARKLKNLDKYGLPIPDAVYKQMDEIAETMKSIKPAPEKLSTFAKIAKGTGDVVKGTAKAGYNITKKVVGLPIRLVLSPITIPIATARASLRVLTGRLGRGSTSLLKRFVGKSGDNIADMERAVRSLFKRKLAANPLLLANMIKTNGNVVGMTKYFKNLDPNAAAMLKDLHKQPIKDIEETLLMFLKRDSKTANWTNVSAADYKNLVNEVTDIAARKGNPYYNTFIKDEVINWSVGKSPGLKFAGAWDAKPWYDWPNTKGVKTLDVLSNEIQDAGEKLGLSDTDDPQGVILQSLVIALRYAGAIDGEDMEAVKDFGKQNIKPIVSMLKNKISQIAGKYGTAENAEEGARMIKAQVYDDIPGLDDNGIEIKASDATASQKWNYLSTHASEFSAETWEFLTMAWDVYKQV